MIVQLLKNKLPILVHRIVGYLSLFWFPLTYLIGTIMIIVRPIEVPWMGMLFALMNMVSIVNSYVNGIRAVFKKQYKLHQLHMEDCFCMMTAPAYLRILYQLQGNNKYDAKGVCRVTNRGFIIGIIMVILLSRSKQKWICFLILFGYTITELLLFGCNLQ